MSEDGKSIAGTWMEGTTPIPLPLERANADTAWAIPEPPKPMAADDSEFAQFRGTNRPITPPAGDNPNVPPEPVHSGAGAAWAQD